MAVMAAVAVGGTIFSSIMGGKAEAAKAAAQRAQFEYQQFQRKMNNQIKNRGIAKANAAKWMNNIKIAEAANVARAEEEFYLGYNFDGATNQLGSQLTSANSKIKAALLAKRGSISGGTAQHLMRVSLNQAKKGMVAQSLNYENAMRTAQRKQDAALNKRDFGYQNQVKFMPGELHQVSEKSIMSQALVSGIVGGIGAGITAHIGQAQADAQIEFNKAQTTAFNAYLNR
jgi:hypothetical protein